MDTRLERIAASLVSLLREGLPQGLEVEEFLFSSHGDGSPETIARVLADRDDPDSATLAGLLLSPSLMLLTSLEPDLESAGLTPEEELTLRSMVSAGTERVGAFLPDGTRLEFDPDDDEIELFVARLRVHATPPRKLTKVLGEWDNPAEAAYVKVLLRHARLNWSPSRAAFMMSLLGTLEPGTIPRPDIVSWTLSWLSCLPPDEPPQEHLGAKQQELSTLLRRSLDFHEALARTSYEVMMAQGARVSLPQPETIRRELAMLDAVCQAVTGRPAWTLAGMNEVDLGLIEDGEAVIDALNKL